jgi:hypothetical protein
MSEEEKVSGLDLLRQIRARNLDRWEYKSFSASQTGIEGLNLCGQDGWELVSSVCNLNGVIIHYMKRRLV